MTEPMRDSQEVIIIGGGIGGLTLALALHRIGVPFRVYEATEAIKPLGVGLNLLPHAMRELSLLGLEPTLKAKGIETREYRFFTRNGQLIQREPRGKYAGYPWPQLSIHRADLHLTLLDEVRARAGDDAVVLGYRCVGVEQDDSAAIVHFENHAGAKLPSVRGPAAIACDGVHSVARAQMHPKEAVPRYEGTTQYRGTTRWKPYLTGATHFYLGTIETGKLVMYPIRDNIDGEGTQLINWVVEAARPDHLLLRDWNRRSRAEEFVHEFEHCNFDWLNIPALMRDADAIYEYPMMDQDPLPFWTQGRITLLGDAAHPMMPRGSNGSAHAIIDAVALAEEIAGTDDIRAALVAYERRRIGPTGQVVLANRDMAPDAIIRVVEERTGGQPFNNIEDVISPDELSAWQARYKKVAGFAQEDLTPAATQ